MTQAWDFVHSGILWMGGPETPLNELELSTRAHGALERCGIKTIEQLIKFQENEILRLPDVGRKHLNEMRENLRLKNMVFATCSDKESLHAAYEFRENLRDDQRKE